eukprot:TRINITY_DN7516_c0_g1_i2.p1 TRINITY_DN7516_c0_g1~~TRINITY_DN7516_c0_g1_i2.p1  ORF type:complete len:591 (+),score=109.18 TRINITY_DN7516_c0_g1_i2:233-1774(+)
MEKKSNKDAPEKTAEKKNKVIDDPLAQDEEDDIPVTITTSTTSSVPSHLYQKFPVNKEINNKLVLWKGDICLLNVDAIVNSTNENMLETAGISGDILSKGGSDLKQEISTLENCRTGECKITKAYNLPSRFIIHTVGPRYNDKYKTAAENALHGCYRSSLQLLKEHNLKSIAFCVINSEKRGYPPENGVHIALRTVRRFLEKWGDGIEKVVFCVSTDEELKLYLAVLPLYCPRNEEEAKKAAHLLPSDTGNEFGETVVEERKIRISAFPSLDSTGNHEYFSSIENDPNDVVMFNTLSDDTDEDRVKRVSARSKAERESDEAARLYKQYLAKARTIDLSEIARLNLLFQSGVDSTGRPIMMFVASRLPENNPEQLEKVFLYIIKLMDSIANKEYIVVYLHTGMANKSKPAFSWLKRMWNVVDAKYGKNLRCFYVLHPTFWLKLVQAFLSKFSSSEFWSKVRYVNRLIDLYEHLDHDQLKIPDDVYKYDHTVHGSPYTSASVPRKIGSDEKLGDI